MDFTDPSRHRHIILNDISTMKKRCLLVMALCIALLGAYLPSRAKHHSNHRHKETVNTQHSKSHNHSYSKNRHKRASSAKKYYSGNSLPAYSYTGPYKILVDKKKLKFYLIHDNKDTIMNVRCCCGENLGQKMRGGDHKTPEGVFSVCSIEDASTWDLNVKKHPEAKTGPYGPWFFRLRCPQSTHIGIHGTSNPQSIGTRASEGCIRLNNKDVETLRNYVKLGMEVKVLPD